MAMTLGHLIVGMHLYGKIPTGIDKLDEQWKLVAKTGVVVVTHQSLALFAHRVV